MFKVPITP